MAPPPSDLSRAISTGNYRLAKRLARQFRFMVSEWSKQTVFINDEALSTKMLPLHQAAGDPDASFRFIQVILELYPSAAWKLDSSGKRLPLHWACEAGAALNVIELLLEHYPEAVAIPDAPHTTNRRNGGMRDAGHPKSSTLFFIHLNIQLYYSTLIIFIK